MAVHKLESSNDEARDLKIHTVPNDGGRDITFVGRQLAHVSSHRHTGPNQNVYDDYAVYETQAGNYVGARQHTSAWEGAAEPCDARSFVDRDSVIQWFGYNKLAKRLYSQLEWNAAEIVD